MKTVLTILLLGVLVAGCGGEKQESTDSRDDGLLTVAAVNYPLAYFAGRIGGDLVDVVYPVPTDVDPAFWNPTAEGVAAYQAADLVLLNGATYAKWVPKVTMSAGRLINTSASFADAYISITDAVTHAHGPGGDHAHTGTAFTTWLDFTQAVVQAEAVREAFAARRPDQSTTFAANFAALEKDLLDLDRRMMEATKGKSDRPVVASHPVYQYLARRYGMNLRAVMWEPEEVPGAGQWAEFKDVLADHPALWMIWEGEPAAESLAALAGMGVQSLVFDPCMNKRDSGDWLEIMRANIEALGDAYQ